MRNIFLFIMVLFTGSALQADDGEVDYVQRMKQVSAELRQASAKIKTLSTEQKKLFMQMHNKRAKLLKNDPELKELHRRIMALHKELALRLDKNKEMQTLKNKAEKVEIQIENLQLRRRTLKIRKSNIDNVLKPKKDKD